jgi:hypothetical protein
MDEPTELSIDEYLERVPDDGITAREAVEPYLDMTPAERLAELAKLGAWMDVLLADREPRSEDGEEPLWRHWKDPDLGRPR